VVGEIVDDHTMVGRALAVLEAVAECGPNTSLGDLAKFTGIPKPTALRIANDLVQRRVMKRTPYGYALGPELSRLGETASLHRDFDRYLPVLEELRAAHGGVAWLTAGRDLVNLQPVVMVCDTGLSVSRVGGPMPGSVAMLINTAGGHLVLAHQPHLLESVARKGMSPSTPGSLREVNQLFASVNRARQDGVAIESEQSAQGWSCAAALLPSTTNKRAIIGVTMPVGQASTREKLRSVSRAFDAIIADIGPLNTVGVEPRRRANDCRHLPNVTGCPS
jgi:DNA-binding IclR family transcriptional regulator